MTYDFSSLPVLIGALRSWATDLGDVSDPALHDDWSRESKAILEAAATALENTVIPLNIEGDADKPLVERMNTDDPSVDIVDRLKDAVAVVYKETLADGSIIGKIGPCALSLEAAEVITALRAAQDGAAPEREDDGTKIDVNGLIKQVNALAIAINDADSPDDARINVFDDIQAVLERYQILSQAVAHVCGKNNCDCPRAQQVKAANMPPVRHRLS